MTRRSTRPERRRTRCDHPTVPPATVRRRDRGCGDRRRAGACRGVRESGSSAAVACRDHGVRSGSPQRGRGRVAVAVPGAASARTSGRMPVAQRRARRRHRGVDPYLPRAGVRGRGVRRPATRGRVRAAGVRIADRVEGPVRGGRAARHGVERRPRGQHRRRRFRGVAAAARRGHGADGPRAHSRVRHRNGDTAGGEPVERRVLAGRLVRWQRSRPRRTVRALCGGYRHRRVAAHSRERVRNHVDQTDVRPVQHQRGDSADLDARSHRSDGTQCRRRVAAPEPHGGRRRRRPQHVGGSGRSRGGLPADRRGRVTPTVRHAFRVASAVSPTTCPARSGPCSPASSTSSAHWAARSST